MPLHLPGKVISLSHFSVFGNLEKEVVRKKRECILERHKERSMLAGLCNCADLIGGERKTISLSRSSVLGNRKGGVGGWVLDREREAALGEGERDSRRMKKSKTVCASLCVFVSVHVQGV